MKGCGVARDPRQELELWFAADDHCLLWNVCDSQVVGNNYEGREKLKSLGIGEKMEAVF